MAALFSSVRSMGSVNITSCNKLPAAVSRQRRSSKGLSNMHHTLAVCCARVIMCSAASSPGAQPAETRSKRSNLLLFLPIAVAGLPAAQGLVPAHCITFAVIYPAYLYTAHQRRFESNTAFASQPVTNLAPWPWVKTYAAVAGVLAVLIPAVLISIPGQQLAVRAMLAPHLFLVTAQIIFEAVSARTKWAMLPRLLVPIGFNTFRMWTLVEWVVQASALGAGHQVLAWANALFWGYNLFSFLLLKMLPLYLDPKLCAT